jgi:hypothetical protein
MENEKRKVGDYTVLCAVNIGSREIIFAENEQSASGERFLCCYGERNDIFERLTIKSQARNAEERQKFRRFKRGIAKLTSFWTPT